jgi:hypothetical protein
MALSRGRGQRSTSRRNVTAARRVNARGAVVGRSARAGYDHEVDYHLTDTGHAFLTDFGVTLPARRAVVCYCVD